MAGIITKSFYAKCKQAFLASFLNENDVIIFTHVDEARKANLHAYKRITIRPAIYERGLLTLLLIKIIY